MRSYDWIQWMLVVAGCIIAALIIFAIVDIRQWIKYRDEHNCQLTGNTKSSIQMVGKVLIDSTSYEWLCDDGTKHWR